MEYDVLVNKKNLIQDDYLQKIKFDKTKNIYGKTILIETKVLESYNELKKYLEQRDIFIAIEDAYRSLEEQRRIEQEFIEKYGEEYAKRIVAQVGTSEHHTGLAIDLCLIVNGIKILENEALVKEVDIWNIIHKELHKFGFILRYPQGKENITGYRYEPWHIRYVGKELASFLFNKNITLEEYYELYKF